MTSFKKLIFCITIIFSFINLHSGIHGGLLHEKVFPSAAGALVAFTISGIATKKVFDSYKKKQETEEKKPSLKLLLQSMISVPGTISIASAILTIYLTKSTISNYLSARNEFWHIMGRLPSSYFWD